MGGNAELDTWWAGLTDTQRQQFKTAAERPLLDPATWQLLIDTNCPSIRTLGGAVSVVGQDEPLITARELSPSLRAFIRRSLG